MTTLLQAYFVEACYFRSPWTGSEDDHRSSNNTTTPITILLSLLTYDDVVEASEISSISVHRHTSGYALKPPPSVSARL